MGVGRGPPGWHLDLGADHDQLGINHHPVQHSGMLAVIL